MFTDDLKLPNANTLLDMNNNILSRCKNGVTRVDVNYVIEPDFIGSKIGRKAHLKYLEDPIFLKMFANKYRSTMFSE